MNKSKFIQGFVFVLFATTATISFAEETLEEQKARLEKEEQQDNSLFRKFYRAGQQILAHEAMPICATALAFCLSSLSSNYYEANKTSYKDHSKLAYYGFKLLTGAGFISPILASVKVKNMARESLEKHEENKTKRGVSLAAVLAQMEKNRLNPTKK